MRIRKPAELVPEQELVSPSHLLARVLKAASILASVDGARSDSRASSEGETRITAITKTQNKKSAVS